MPIVLGNNTITGLVAGGLPAGSVTSTTLDASARLSSVVAQQNSQQTLSGDSGWVNHLSTTFTVGIASRITVIFTVGVAYESGPVQGFFRILLDGVKIGVNWCGGRQTTVNTSAVGSGLWAADVAAGSHTVTIQARNSVGGSTWITPYWSVDGEGANTLVVLYYA